jgi:hypothetical protein
MRSTLAAVRRFKGRIDIAILLIRFRLDAILLNLDLRLEGLQ